MNRRFAEINLIKMIKTMKEIKSYITKEIRGTRNLQFTSQDMRRWAMALSKTLKALMRDVEFDRFQDKLYKNSKITNDVFIEECKNIQKKLNLAMDLQPLTLEVNYYATIVYVLEEKIRTMQEESDDLFNDAILSALIEAY